MAWYWWLLIVVAILGLISAAGHSNEPYEEDNAWAERLGALVIIDDLKYKHPEAWAKCASEIMGRQIDPPTPEQVARWNEQRKQRK